jgi:hypothetical protein
MKAEMNVWDIKEYEGDGASCPIAPVNLPWPKKVLLTFFRFGICPMCVTMSVSYSIGRFFRSLFQKKASK